MSAKWTVRFGIIRQIEFPTIVAIPGHRKNGNNTHKMERPRCTSRPTFSLQEKKKKNRDTKILEKELCSHVQTEEE
jgi:hypothetical protein